MNIDERQLEDCLRLQNSMNCTISPEWAFKGWDYMRAAMVEGCEAVDHHGWKWWKKQEINMPQLQMEIVDIWHFYLSHSLQSKGGDVASAKKDVLDSYAYELDRPISVASKTYFIDKLSLLEKIDLIVGLSAFKIPNYFLFFSIAKDCGLNWNSLFAQYAQKNVLNVFRQKNGYKEGTYHKEWFGKEDNDSLVEIAATLDSSDSTYADLLWKALETRYAEALLEKTSKSA